MNHQQLMGALSADLRRISYWIYKGQDHLVRIFLSRDQQMIGDVDLPIGQLTLREQLERISMECQDVRLRRRAADRALTASRILWHLSERRKNAQRHH